MLGRARSPAPGLGLAVGLVLVVGFVPGLASIADEASATHKSDGAVLARTFGIEAWFDFGQGIGAYPTNSGGGCYWYEHLAVGYTIYWANGRTGTNQEPEQQGGRGGGIQDPFDCLFLDQPTTIGVAEWQVEALQLVYQAPYLEPDWKLAANSDPYAKFFVCPLAEASFGSPGHGLSSFWFLNPGLVGAGSASCPSPRASLNVSDTLVEDGGEVSVEAATAIADIVPRGTGHAVVVSCVELDLVGTSGGDYAGQTREDVQAHDFFTVVDQDSPGAEQAAREGIDPDNWFDLTHDNGCPFAM